MVEVMALQMGFLFDSLLRDAQLLRCVRVWLGLGPVQHSQTVGGQFSHMLLEYLVDSKLDCLEEPKSEVLLCCGRFGSGACTGSHSVHVASPAAGQEQAAVHAQLSQAVTQQELSSRLHTQSGLSGRLSQNIHHDKRMVQKVMLPGCLQAAGAVLKLFDLLLEALLKRTQLEDKFVPFVGRLFTRLLALTTRASVSSPWADATPQAPAVGMHAELLRHKPLHCRCITFGASFLLALTTHASVGICAAAAQASADRRECSHAQQQALWWLLTSHAMPVAGTGASGL